MLKDVNKLSTDLMRLSKLLKQEVKIISTRNEYINLLNKGKVDEVVHKLYTPDDFSHYVTSSIIAYKEFQGMTDLKKIISFASQDFAKDVIDKIYNYDGKKEEAISFEAYEITTKNLGTEVEVTKDCKILHSKAYPVITAQFEKIFEVARKNLGERIDYKADSIELSKWFEDHVTTHLVSNSDALYINY